MKNEKRSRFEPAGAIGRRMGPSARAEGRGPTAATGVRQAFPEPIYAPPATPSCPVEIDDTFPARPYRSRRGELKSAIHWGQRKLLLSELQLLNEALTKCGAGTKFTIVYAGSAPGTHLRFLDELFPGHSWHLIDPIAFDTAALGSLCNFTLRNEYFTCGTASEFVARRMADAGAPALSRVFSYCTDLDATARQRPMKDSANLIEGVEATGETATPQSEIPAGLGLLSRVVAARSPMLFICDIRSGSVSQLEDENDGGDAAASPTFRGVEFERHVEADMHAQMLWVEYLQPTFALLKFRLPYMEVYHPITKELVYTHPHATTKYLRGRVLLPIWTRPTSTECRLLVEEGAPRVEYDNRRYEEQCFFFNSVMRERYHFPHSVDAPTETYLDHRFDGSAEVQLLEQYLRLRDGDAAVTPDAVLRLSRRITDSLGKSFEVAANRLSKVLLRKAADRGHTAATEGLVNRAEEYRCLPCWWTNRRGDDV
uniref:Cap-specific mRNA (nucleoside-2'-O-)-methyltransferase n=1 Tax=Neobodo designis TaxID=312471 RepID=A0A7S1LSQ6_NEODS|mmetsp:Transcript_26625/g.82350  ORF Transcript_26625/g.82350 Transcript_26625/m.82350 type:complete len:484 (+) Transcript_26625:60-1511(+)